MLNRTITYNEGQLWKKNTGRCDNFVNIIDGLHLPE